MTCVLIELLSKVHVLVDEGVIRREMAICWGCGELMRDFLGILSELVSLGWEKTEFGCSSYRIVRYF